MNEFPPWELVERSLDDYFALPHAERAAFLAGLSECNPQLHEFLAGAIAGRAARWIDSGVGDGTPELIRQAVSDDTLPAGFQFGPYRVVELLGRGGMGEVYLCQRDDGEVDQCVAVKLLSAELMSTLAEHRFLRERQILARLHHPSIAALHDAGKTADGRSWFAQELIRGSPLIEFCEQEGLGDEARIGLVIDVCKAISHAHANGVVHRDLKPGNILVEQSRDGPRVYVTDFGVALATEREGLTRTGQILGTPAYMSPEQARGDHESVDHRSDIFSLGIVLYELLEGRRPFAGENATDITYRILHDEPSPPARRSRPADLRAIVFQCLEKDPDHRYPSADDLGKDLQAYLDGGEVLARHRSAAERAWRRVKSHPGVAGLAAVFFVVVSLLGTFAVIQLNSKLAFARNEIMVADRYGRAAEQIQSQVRLVYSRPRHRISDELANLHARFWALYNQLPSAAEAGFYVAHARLGKAALALGLNEEALNLLGAAWAMDQADPILAVELGRAHINQYTAAIERLAGLADADDRDKGAAVARLSHLDPGMSLLKLGLEADGEHAVIARILLAVNSGHEEVDLQRAFQEAVWPVRPMILAARIELNRGQAALLAGNHDEAREALQPAQRLFEEAADNARSHPEALGGACLTAALLATLGDGPSEEWVTPCGWALEVDPEGLETLLTVARAFARVADHELLRGRDASKMASRAVALAEKAAKANPAGVRPLQMKGSAYLILSSWEYEAGLDPTENLHRAIDALLGAQRLTPADPTVHTELANAYLKFGRIEYARGSSGDAAFDEAIAHLEQASRLPGAPYHIQARILEAMVDKAYYLFPEGDRAEPVLRSAMDRVEQMESRSLNRARDLRAKAVATWTYATWLMRRNKNPVTFVDKSVEAYLRVIETDESAYGARFNLISVFGLGIEYQLQHGKSQVAELQEMEGFLRDLEANAAENLNTAIQWGYYHRLRAVQAVLSDEDPERHIAEARQFLTESLATVIDRYQAMTQLARLIVFESEWRRKTHRWDPARFREDDELLSKGALEFPKMPILKALHGRLLLVAATEPTFEPAARDRMRSRGAALLQQAISDSPSLAAQFGQVGRQP